MSKYIYFIKLKHFIFKNEGSSFFSRASYSRPRPDVTLVDEDLGIQNVCLVYFLACFCLMSCKLIVALCIPEPYGALLI
jgi:hypothetical protein